MSEQEILLDSLKLISEKPVTIIYGSEVDLKSETYKFDTTDEIKFYDSIKGLSMTFQTENHE